MADFMQAIKWLKEGKKVRRPSFEEEEIDCISLTDDSQEYRSIGFLRGGIFKKELRSCELQLRDYEATDWELFGDLGLEEK